MIPKKDVSPNGTLSSVNFLKNCAKILHHIIALKCMYLDLVGQEFLIERCLKTETSSNK